MRFFAGLVTGFVAGCFYAIWETVEVEDGIATKIISGIKTILEVL